MAKKQVCVGTTKMFLETIPVLIILEHEFENGLIVEMYEIDGIFLVIIEKKKTNIKTVMAFLEKCSAIDFIEMHVGKVRDDEDI